MTDDLREIAELVDLATYSHVDGRDLFAQIHPRKTLDIKRRVDGVETWFEGDWLSNLYDTIRILRKVLDGGQLSDFDRRKLGYLRGGAQVAAQASRKASGESVSNPWDLTPNHVHLQHDQGHHD